jgi:hypothetical protein
MTVFKSTLIISLLFLISGCFTTTDINLARDDDDFGIGGTGIMLADNNGLGGTGIIGEITGFGSIFVNGIEVELNEKTLVSVNNQVVRQHDFKIGEVVEILSRDKRKYTHAIQINVRHEVIGPVTSINKELAQVTVLGQIVKIKPDMEINIGDQVAVSGFKSPDGQIHATLLTRTGKEKVLLRGNLHKSKSGLKMLGFQLQFSDLPQAKQKLVVEGNLENDRINVTRWSIEKLFRYASVSKWLIQGFPSAYQSTWNKPEDLNHQNNPLIFVLEPYDKDLETKIHIIEDKLPSGSPFRIKPQGFEPSFSLPGKRMRMTPDHGFKP